MIRRIVTTVISKNISQINRTVTSAAKKEKWDLYAGVLVERLPVITKSLTPLENEFQTMLNQIEFENSLRSDHEIRHQKDMAQAELIKKGDIDFDVDMDTASKATAQDMEDAYIEELNKFQFEPRITEADKKNDIKSLNRKLENILVLLVEQKLGDKKYLLLPQGKREDGETMRQTAERVLKATCGDNMNVLFYGNAPCGFYKYKYPASNRTDAVGAKVFFYRSVHSSGQVDAKSTQYEWLDKTELKQKLQQPYYHSVSQFLF